MTLVKDQSMKQSTVIVECLANYNWLNVQLLSCIKQRFNSRLILICGNQQSSEVWREILGNEDEVILTDDIVSRAKNIEKHSIDGMEIVKNFETEYSVSLICDIFQQSRSSFVKFVPYLVERRLGGGLTFEESIAETIEAIKLANSIIQNRDISFMYVRPGGILSTVLVFMAQKHQIPITFVRPSRYKSLFNWTCGAFSSGKYLRHKMADVDEKSVATYDISHEKSDVKKKLKKFANSNQVQSMLRSLLLIFLNSLLHNFAALMAGRVYKGVSLLSQLELFLAERWVFYWLNRKARLQPLHEGEKYFLFLLPVEPEFTVNSLGRSFSDVKSLIWNISLRLPIGYKLVIKEHAKIGFRNMRFYTDLLSLPNVIVSDIRTPGSDLVSRSSGVFSIAGTSPIEAGMSGLRSIVFCESVEYDALSFVQRCRCYGDLAYLIRSHLINGKMSNEQIILETKRYLLALENVSFEALSSPVFGGDGSEKVDVERVMLLLDECIKFQREMIYV